MSALERYEPPRRLDEIERLAGHFAGSGLFGNSPKTQGEIIVKMLAGAENGIPPFASVQGIHVIQGKPEIGADLLARSVKQSGRYDYRVRRIDDEACVLEFFDNDESLGVSEFSMVDAKRAGLAGGMYGKYPRNMLFARAMSNGVSWYCPDATSTRFYVDGEISQTPAPSETVIHDVTVEPDDDEGGAPVPSRPVQPRPSPPTAARVPDPPVEPSPPIAGEPAAIVAEQLAKIGPDGRKRLKAHMRALDAVKGDQRKPETWIAAIIENWYGHWDESSTEGPMYANLARVLDALDAIQNVDTPVERRDADDAKYDSEAEGLFQEQNGPDVRTIPMYGEGSPS